MPQSICGGQSQFFLSTFTGLRFEGLQTCAANASAYCTNDCSAAVMEPDGQGTGRRKFIWTDGSAAK